MRPPVLPHLKTFLATLLAVITIAGAFADSPDFAEGVKSYRKGNYSEAGEIFTQLHAQEPQDTKVTYYLAITSAQLGRFQQARAFYEEILLLDPNGEAAKLAQAGLKYLPAENAPLDLPPRFNVNEAAAMPQNIPQQVQPQAALPNGMSQQELMSLQMMMAQMGGGGNNQNGGGGMNMLPFMMPQGAGDGANPMSNMDPNVMSSMMMNQMMQNFDFSGSKDKD
jgi:tetratricopeptide (TPR) repeat protein